MPFESAVGANPSVQPGSGQHIWQPGSMSDVLNSTFGQPRDVNTPPTQVAPPQSNPWDALKLPPVVAPPMDQGLTPTAGSPTNDGGQSTPNDTTESEASKIAREGLVMGGALGRSFLYGMASLPQRIPEIGASLAIGAALSTLSKAGSMGAAATFVVGAYFTSKFLVNAINDTARWNKFGAAVTDTWHTNQHKMKNLRDMSDSGGNFAFDTSLSMASGYVGYNNKALGELILSVIKLPIPLPPAEVPLPPAFMGATMYMDVVPAPFLYKSAKEDEAIQKLRDLKLSSS